VALADEPPSTAAIFRCVYALPLLVWFAAREDRALGARPHRERRLAAVAGVLFAADLVLWHHAIADVGAGLSTVLANSQVAIVPLAAWLVLRERPAPGVVVAVPLVLLGVVGISGTLEDGAFGAHPVRGAVLGVLCAVAYAGFLLVLRQAAPGGRRIAGPLSDATAVAAVVALVVAVPLGEAELVPTWPSHGWLVLLALTSQVLGWLLIGASLPRLPASLTSVLLTLQPVGSVVLAAVLLAEAPSALQLTGVALVVAGLLAVARRRRA
jgi:drug/metabolite transporter (DMT)-like permease